MPSLHLAIRGLRRAPLFAVTAIVSLALGIGANTAIFTVLDQILLRRLPVRDPGELVMIYQNGSNMGSNSGVRMNSYPLYQDLQQKAESLAEVMCRRVESASVAMDDRTERVEAELVSGNYFSMLGVGPALGRVFDSADDDQTYLGHPSVVLSYAYWTRRFARDPHVIGRTMRVNDHVMTIVGVSAEHFVGLDPTDAPDIRIPILMQPIIMPEAGWLHMNDRRSRWVQVFARLKPGYTLASAQASMQGLFTQIRAYEMTLPAAKDWSAYSRTQFMKGRLLVATAEAGYSPLRNEASTSLIVLMCMVGLVLLIACANVANLLIARGLARQKEIAVRLSLGCSRGRIVGQLLVENGVIATIGGAVGLGLAFFMTRTLVTLVSTPDQQVLLSAVPDLRVLAFTIVVTSLTAALFGLFPALGASRPDPWTTLKDAMTSVAGGSQAARARKGLVALQVALSFLLLTGAGLFAGSLRNLERSHTGLALDNLIGFQLAPALNGYDNPRAAALNDRLLGRLRSASIVQSAGIASVPVLAGSEWDMRMNVEGHVAADGEDMQAYMNAVSPGYFDTMKIPILEGRDFTIADAHDHTTTIIVNRSFANHFFPDGQAVGKHMGEGPAGSPLNYEIVGVVGDSLYEGPREGIHRQAFEPQWGRNGTTFYVRARDASAPVYDLIRQAVREIDPSLPIYGMKTVDAQLDETLLDDRLVAMLSAAFGGLATLLASIGLYGVMAFVVLRRKKELGIRVALGARPAFVLWLVMREVLVLLALGLAAGVPASLALGGCVGTQLYGIQPRDPAVLISVVILLAVVSAAAGLVPARRASRIDPILVLRHE